MPTSPKMLAFWRNKTNQGILCIFFFFLTYPNISIYFSITFYIFIALMCRAIIKKVPAVKSDTYASRVVFLFGVSACLSALLSPPEQRESDNIYAIILTQFIYWVFLAAFIIANAKYFNFYRISKYIFVGICFLSVDFFLIKDAFNFAFFTSSMNRNEYAYIMICFFPLSTWYINTRYKSSTLLLYMLMILILMLLTDGRSAGLLIFIECICMLQVYFVSFQKIFKRITIFALLVIAVVSSNLDTNEIRKTTGNVFSNISPRLAEFIEGTGRAGNLEADESWLIRKLMIKKALEINHKYPFFGIGPFKFSRYNAELSEAYEYEFRYLNINELGVSFFNRRSSHNSYIMVLAEQGWVGLTIFLLIIGPLVLWFLYRLIFSSIGQNDIPLISAFAISLHFYAISALPNSITWVILGLAYARIHGRLNYMPPQRAFRVPADQHIAPI